jgi:hypothetical protein
MRRIVIASVVLGAGVLLAACGGGEQPVAVQSTVTVTTTVKPAGDQTAFLAALTAIDKGLATNADRAVTRGRDVCLDLKQGKDAVTVATNARQRFTGGPVTLTAEQAALVVTAAQQHLCG